MSDVARPHAHPQLLIADAFVELVDSLVGDFDVIDVLTVLADRSVQLLEVSAAAILLADESGRLRVTGASTERIDLLELFQIQNDEGPGLECFRSGHVVFNTHLDTDSAWPKFAAESVSAGFPSVCAVPLRLDNAILGCLNLFMSEPVGLPSAATAVAQALADVASVTIMQNRATRDAAIRETQLRQALTSRIAIEQAKGMIAEHRGVDMDAAFARLRSFARTNNRRLTDVADAVVARTLAIGSLTASGAGSRTVALAHNAKLRRR